MVEHVEQLVRAKLLYALGEKLCPRRRKRRRNAENGMWHMIYNVTAYSCVLSDIFSPGGYRLYDIVLVRGKRYVTR